MKRTNAWVQVQEERALIWKEWLYWGATVAEEEERPAEPVLSAREKQLAGAVTDKAWHFEGFARSRRGPRHSILLSLYDVSEQDLQQAENELGDDFEVLGFWTWEPGDQLCRYVPSWDWNLGRVLRFMPPRGETPPSVISDTNLVFGQPPREFPHPGS